jgi:hypothetical protein
MKLKKENIEFKKKNDNLFEILCEGQKLEFNTPTVYLPFGIENVYGKQILKMELYEKNKESVLYLKQQQLYQIIKKMERYLIEMLELKEGELKSILREREDRPPLIEGRLKCIKNHLLVDVSFPPTEEYYMKTVWDISSQMYVHLFLDIYGYWDYRQPDKFEKHKVGLLLYIKKINVHSDAF